MKVLKREISLSPMSQKCDLDKVDPFGPAVSERSLPEFKKETAGHEPRRCGGSSAVSIQAPHDTINKQTTTDRYETSYTMM